MYLLFTVLCFFVLNCYCTTDAYSLSDSNKIQVNYQRHTIIKRQERPPDNITKLDYDDHTYYLYKVMADPDGLYWREIDNRGRSTLSNDKYLRYTWYQLSFDFPFYGHPINEIAVTTQGFLYMSSFVHPDLDWAYTHYVAPLMGNFDTIGHFSHIFTMDDGNSFIVEWRDVDLNDQPEIGNFTFQTVLYKNGTIVIAYKSVPTTNYSDAGWPVKAGINDAYYYDVYNWTTGHYIRYIVPYHNITIPLEDIKDNTVIIIHPLPTCNIMKTCIDCTSNLTSFDCSWCPSKSRCSDGTDRLRQDWIDSLCHKTSYTTPDQCPTTECKRTTVPTPTMKVSTSSTLSSAHASSVPLTTSTTKIQTSTTVSTASPSTETTSPHSSSTATTTMSLHPQTSASSSPRLDRLTRKKEETSSAAVAIPIVIILLLLVVLIGGWVFYARTHPSTRSGIWLIENSPSRIKNRITSFFKSSSDDDTSKIVSKYEVHNDSSC